VSAVRQSLLFSGLERYVAQLLGIGTTAVMARILTPAETGLFLVTSAVILVAENFRDFGVGAYLVQARELSREVIQSAFTVTMLLSVAMGLVIFACADRIAGFYGQPDLYGLIVAASLGFLFMPFATPIVALLRRDLAFRPLAGISIAAALTNAGVTIALGVVGFGPISYVWGYVASNALLALLAFLVRPEAWIFRPSLADVRRVLSFGAISASVTVANVAYDLLPRLAFARILGFDAVGFYARAVTICQLPDRTIVSALQPVVLPAMAARVRDGGDLKQAYLRGHELMSAIQWPALIMLALLADPVVRIILGAQWGEVPALVRPMAVAMMALAPAFMTFPVLVAAGRVRDTLVSSLISLPPSVLIVIGAASYGLPAVAASLIVVAPLQMVVALVFIRRAIGLRWSELAHASRASLAMTLATAAIPCAVVALSPTGFILDWIQTMVAATGGALGWLAGLWFVDHPLRREIVVVRRLALDMPARRRTFPAAPD
jgi:O-antigen/teichoic acid export membrane protein